MEKNFVVYFTDKETITVPMSLIKYFLLFETFNEEEGLEIFHVPKRSESDMILWQSMIDILVKHEESMSTVATLNSEIDAFTRIHNPHVFHLMSKKLFCDTGCIATYLSA